MQFSMKFFRRLHKKEMQLEDTSDYITFRPWLRNKLKSKTARKAIEDKSPSKKVVAIINKKRGSK